MRLLGLAIVLGSASALGCGSSSNSLGPNDAGAPGAGSDGGGAVDTGGPGVGNGTPGSSGGIHAYPPQLIDQGGPVLTAPSVVTVTFPADPNRATYQAFGATATSNAWWDAVRQGYCETGSTTACVGDGPAGTKVELTIPAAVSYTDSQDPTAASTIKTFINAQIKVGKLPAPTDQTLYVLYFPATTTITLNPGAQNEASSCVSGGFGGYHNSSTYNGTPYTYAIIPECAPFSGTKLTQVQQTTLAASHELIEAATDPFITASTSGFYLDLTDLSILPWNALGGGESADMCVDPLKLGQDETTEGGFTVQRIWNNAQAAAGHDPCVPATPAPYFNVAPERWLVLGNVGATVTFDADAYADGAMSGGWTLEGADLQAQSAADPNPYLSFTFDGTTIATVNDGDRIHVGITLNQDPAAIGGGAFGALVSVTGPKGARTAGHIWPILVTTAADAVDAGLGGLDASTLTRTPSARYLQAIHALGRIGSVHAL